MRIGVIVLDAVGTLIYPRPGVATVYWQAGRAFGSRLLPSEIRSRFRRQLTLQPQPDYAAPLAAIAGEKVPGARVDGADLASETIARRVAHDAPHDRGEAAELAYWRSIVESVFTDVLPSRLGCLFRWLWEHFARAQNWRLFGDVAETLCQLRSTGCKLVIASNFDLRLERICRGHPPLHGMPVYCSSQLQAFKPSADFYRRLQLQLDVPAGKLLMVGDDRARDVDAARAAGWHALHVDRHHHHHRRRAAAPNAIHRSSQAGLSDSGRTEACEDDTISSLDQLTWRIRC